MDKKNTNMGTFFKEIKEKIIGAVKDDFPKIKEELGEEKPYAVAFVTDSDCITLLLWVNTYEFLEKTDAEYAEDGDDYTTKWNPDEWGYLDENSQFVKISDELFDKKRSVIDHMENQTDNLSNDELGNLIDDSGFTRLFFETVISAFQELIQSNVFGFDHEEITYFITMNDDERAVEIENNSAKVLNSKKVYEEFLKRKTYY